MTDCSAILKTAKRQGEVCGKYAVTEGLCGVHRRHNPNEYNFSKAVIVFADPDNVDYDEEQVIAIDEKLMCRFEKEFYSKRKHEYASIAKYWVWHRKMHKEHHGMCFPIC